MKSETNKLDIRYHHDIPPQIVVDLGSFILESDKSIANDPQPPDSVGDTGSNFTGSYKDTSNPPKKVEMVLIKVIRTDDGAIIYQNFDAIGAGIEFTTRQTAVIDPEFTLKPENEYSIKFQTRTGSLEVRGIDRHGRKQSLKEKNIKIRNVTVKNKNGTTLFSHTIEEHDQYQYRVMIIVETHL